MSSPLLLIVPFQDKLLTEGLMRQVFMPGYQWSPTYLLQITGESAWTGTCDINFGKGCSSPIFSSLVSPNWVWTMILDVFTIGNEPGTLCNSSNIMEVYHFGGGGVTIWAGWKAAHICTSFSEAAMNIVL